MVLGASKLAMPSAAFSTIGSARFGVVSEVPQCFSFPVSGDSSYPTVVALVPTDTALTAGVVYPYFAIVGTLETINDTEIPIAIVQGISRDVVSDLPRHAAKNVPVERKAGAFVGRVSALATNVMRSGSRVIFRRPVPSSEFAYTPDGNARKDAVHGIEVCDGRPYWNNRRTLGGKLVGHETILTPSEV